MEESGSLGDATGENQVKKHVKHLFKTLLYVRSSCVASILRKSSVWITCEKDLFPCDVRILRFYSRICSVRSPCVFRVKSVCVPCMFRVCSVHVPCVFRVCSVLRNL